MIKPAHSFFDDNEIISKIKHNLQTFTPGAPFFFSSMPGSSKNLFLRTIFNKNNQFLLLQPKIELVNEVKVELDILGLGEYLIAFDDLNFEVVQENLTKLSYQKNCIVIASYDILTLNIPAKRQLENKTIKIGIGGEIKYDEVAEYFNLFNYQKVKFVDSVGEFSVRGSIIDFWSFSEKQPSRIEFDGDFIESIRLFDPESQRSSKKIESITLADSIQEEGEFYNSDIFDYLLNPIVIASQIELNICFEQNSITPIRQAVSLVEDDDIDDELRKELFFVDDKEIEDVGISKENIELSKKQLTFNEFFIQTKGVWLIEDELNINENLFNLGFFEAPSINSNFEVLFSIISDYTNKNYKVYITVENELQGRRLLELFSGLKEEFEKLVETGKVSILTLAIKKGFISRGNKTLILTDYQIFNKPYRTKISSKVPYKKSRVKDFASIKKGDFVVHDTFGIGQYTGLETIKIGETEQESIKILYAEGAVVYVNLNYLSLVKKFSSRDDAQPKLSTLGSNEWKTAKRKVKAKIVEAARELIKLYAKRRGTLGYSFSPDSIWQKELEASFLYEDTPDQAKVTEEVKADMESVNPMDRLVCGDVGFGKTEIAVRAAFKSVTDGKQVALLVPTTILAEQHFSTFTDRLNMFPVRVAALSRFQTKAEQKIIITNIAAGLIDIVIGTHRILSKDVSFKDLGLLIIDEEHRFGVMAKEKLRTIKATVDTLTLTATPIPRTLNLSLLGARDLSLIATPPPNRQPIFTKVVQFDIVLIREWITNELRRNGQVYFIHDRVQSIEKIATYLKKHIPHVNIAVAHGQMKPADLEKVIYEFLNKRFQILIATKIIESGIDIPNVNTIIINRADRFGLAELHQLRGRVGRSDKQAYAYLLVPSLNSISKKATRRLQAIEEYTELGTGFNLSMRDLEIRGAGNLLGTEQSGVIDTVGFDMYMKLLDEAVEELKKGEFSEEFKDLPKQLDRVDTTIDAFFEVGIPKTYMPDQSDRLSFYTAMFSLIKLEEMDEIKEELIDRFGKIPVIVERLILTAILRYYSSFALFERIIILKNKIVIYLPKGDNEVYYKEKFPFLAKFVMDKKSSQVSFKNERQIVKLEMIHKSTVPEAILNFLIDFCKEVKDIINN
ncbi:MAG: transcription-repair coupling factor [bacterium]